MKKTNDNYKVGTKVTNIKISIQEPAENNNRLLIIFIILGAIVVPLTVYIIYHFKFKKAKIEKELEKL